jgi:hypothetical protein
MPDQLAYKQAYDLRLYREQVVQGFFCFHKYAVAAAWHARAVCGRLTTRNHETLESTGGVRSKASTMIRSTRSCFLRTCSARRSFPPSSLYNVPAVQ